jgi:hypothetical protein
MGDKRARKARNDSATGLRLAMIEAATAYPEWPTELVKLPRRQRDRQRALAWYAALLKHRTPSAWQPADPARVALLSRTLAAWERELWLLQERDGGDANMLEKWRGVIATLSRALGLSTAIRDPRLAAGDAMARARAAELEGDDLLARPRPN